MATPFSFADFTNSGMPTLCAREAQPLSPCTRIAAGISGTSHFASTPSVSPCNLSSDVANGSIVGRAAPFIFPERRAATNAGNRNSPWECEPSRSAFVSVSAKAAAFSASAPFRRRHSSASLRISDRVSGVVDTDNPSGGTIQLGHDKFAVPQGFRRRQPSVGGAHDHVNELVAGGVQIHLSPKQAGNIDINCARPWCEWYADCH